MKRGIFWSIFIVILLVISSYPFSLKAQTVMPEVISTTASSAYGTYNLEIYIPANTTGTLPTVVFIPGNGEVGTNRTKLYSNGPLNFIKNSGWRPNFIVVGAQPAEVWPNKVFVHAVLNALLANPSYRVNPNKIYITGLSGGAAGIGEYIKNQTNPVPVAAVVPMSITMGASCGDFYANTDYLCGGDLNWGNVASWGMAGTSDSHHEKMKRFFQRLGEAGYTTKWTEWAGGHSGWNTFYNPSWTHNGLNIYDWMLQYSTNGSNPPTNTPPTSNAGTDQNITLPTSSVTLSGSGTDTGGSISSYAWTKVSGTGGTISSPSSASTTVTGLTAGSYTYRLTVTDNGGLTATDDVKVTVNAQATTNNAPVANAGSDKTITLPNNSVSFSGSATDPDGDSMIYSWTKISGGNATISSPTSLNTNITGLVEGTYTFWLTVTDSKGATNADAVAVIVNPAIVTGGGNESQSPIVHYTFDSNNINWSNTNGEIIDSAGTTNGNATGLSSSNVVTGKIGQAMSFTGNQYIISGGASSVLPSSNYTIATWVYLPTTSSNYTIFGKATTNNREVQLISSNTGKVSSFAGGINNSTNTNTPVSQWAHVALVNNGSTAKSTTYLNGTAIFTGNTGTATASGIDLLIGARRSSSNNDATVFLTGSIDDFRVYNRALSSSEISSLYTGASSTTPTNTAPTANAGNDQTITLPTSSVTLSGSGTDTGGSISSYAWTKVSGTGGTISSPSSASTTVTGLTQGSYTFRLTVTDNGGATDTDDVVVTVNNQTTPAATGDIKVGPGEYQTAFIDSNGYLWAVGNISNIGVNGSGTVGVPQRVKVTPSDLKFKEVAGGLHSLGAIDVYGNVWMMGDNDFAQHGQGNTTHPVLLPQKILTDNSGNPFTNVKSLALGFRNVGGQNFQVALKEDGTIWAWGYLKAGLRGNGTNVDELTTRPVQISLPGGRLAKQIIAGTFIMALAIDGTVWTWGDAGAANLGYPATGMDYATPHQVSGLTGIEQIAGGLLWNYALKSNGTLYGWGAWGEYLGNQSGNAVNTPTVLTNITNSLPSTIKKIVTNSFNTYVILSDKSLWAWGNGGQGTIGNGQKMNFATGGNPFDRANLVVRTPYNVAPTKKFDDVFGATVYTYYVYALDDNGQLYSWGRNKGSVLADRVRSAGNGALDAAYGNSWDVAWPTPVNPFNISSSYEMTASNCISTPSISPCNQYTIPANTPPTANAGSDISVSGSTATLSGSGTDNVFIPYYEWSQVSGPNTAIIDLPASKTAKVSGLVTGTYVFQLKVTDTGWATDTDTVQIFVNGTAPTVNVNPIANAGTDQSVTLPVNSVALAGTGSDIDGTISKYAWTKVSGTGGTISSPSSASTTVTGLTQGSYTFRLTVTDNGGATDTDDVAITVNPVASTGGGTGTGGTGTGGGSSSGGGGGGGGGGSSSGSGSTTTNSNRAPVVNAGSDVTIKSPNSSVMLSGSATDPDGSIKSYQWKKVSGSSAEIQSLSKSSTKVLGLKVGSYTFRLIATDDKKSSSYDDVNVTIVSSTSTASVGYSNSSSSSSSNTSGSSSSVKVIATELNVRSTPGGSVVGKVQGSATGEIVSTKEEIKDGISWIQVTFKNGLKGWVSSKYISKVSTTVSTPVTSGSKPSSSLPTTGVGKSSNLQDIKNLQAFLNWVLGSKITPLVVDGKYGPKTTETIKLYQSMNGLTADGLFGKNSSSKANSLISN